MIFGNAAPKFQVSAVDVLLDHAVIEKDDVDYKTIEHESGLDRGRSFITKPEHHIFQVLIHLHRYQDPKAKHDEIIAHLNSKIVKLWRHRDGQAFQDDASADADFIFIEYQQIYITTTDYADGLRLLFKSVDTIDHSDFGDNWTFARALTGGSSNAWYLDPTSGLFVVAPDTTTSRRLVKGRYKGTAIVIEGAATNLITHPSAFDNAAWLKTNITVGANTGETLDPSDTSVADRLLATAAAASAIFTTGTPVGNTVALAGRVKCPSATVPGTLTVNGTTGGSDTTGTFTATPEWKPFSHIVDSSGFTGNLRCNLTITNNTNIIYVWGVGLYDNFEFGPTIVDPLATAGATRALEKFTILSANTKLTKLQGTVSMLFKPYFDPLSFSSDILLFESGDSAGGAGDKHIRLIFDGTGTDKFLLSVKRDNTTTDGLSWNPSAATGMTQDTWAHIVLTWDASISNGGHIYVNGAELNTGSSNSAFNVSETGDTIALGAQLDNSTPAFGEYDELFIDDRVWPAEEVLAVFNLPNGLPRTLI